MSEWWEISVTIGPCSEEEAEDAMMALHEAVKPLGGAVGLRKWDEGALTLSAAQVEQVRADVACLLRGFAPRPGFRSAGMRDAYDRVLALLDAEGKR